MRRNKPLRENGIVVGNIEDKQNLSNPIARLMVQNFNQTLIRMIKIVNPTTVLEVGCGEGAVTRMLLENTRARIKSTDISEAVLTQARAALSSDRVTFECRDLYAMSGAAGDAADLLVCCEVLEHLPDLDRALALMRDLATPYALFSVPREPLWRIMNLMRGSYIKSFGNTPGHLQHWSRRGFVKLIEAGFELVEIAQPLPWSVILGRVRR